MARVAVLYCKKVKDHSCIACAKCYKGMAEKNGEYGRHDEIELVAMTDCGDCPGLVVPRVKLLTEKWRCSPPGPVQATVPLALASAGSGSSPTAGAVVLCPSHCRNQVSNCSNAPL